MRILCVNGSKFLKKGHWYEVISYSGNTYTLKNDTNIKWQTTWYHEVNFKTIKQLREEKLKN